MKYIYKLKLKNFCKFKDLTIEFDENLNILLGDNEAGKSTILSAIDIVLSGSRSKVETYGLESLFNNETIQEFLSSDKKIENLPVLYIELYINENGNKDLDGKYNSLNESGHGLLLICEPREDLSKEIKEILNQNGSNFPFEYYSMNFKTFSGESFTGYRKFISHLLLDNTQINNEYATKRYIKTIYQANTTDPERSKYQNEYRNQKKIFEENKLVTLNSKVNEYSFSIRSNSKSNLETDLSIQENNIDIENRGKGRQCFIKTDFALQKNGNDLDIILLEEPENHLSHLNMKKLIEKIKDSTRKQLFITTHNSLISTRLDLRKSIFLNSNSNTPINFKELEKGTAKFFMKAPDNNILEYVLSKKVILVEGDAEFILMQEFFELITMKKPEELDVHIISVDGTSFKRYLEISKILKIKTAVIRDNDGDRNEMMERYSEYRNDENIKIFIDSNNELTTFEIAIYNENKKICDDLFLEGRRTLSVQEYMLKNKADCAFKLLDATKEDLVSPKYIREAIKWIKE